MLFTIPPVAVQLFCFSTHLLYTGCIFEENEAKTSWPAGVLVDLYGAVRHFSKFIEVILQVFLTCVPAKTTDKHFPRDIKRPGRENVSTVMSEPLHRGTTRLRNGGSCECTRCSRTSVDPMTFSYRLQLMWGRLVLSKKRLPWRTTRPKPCLKSIIC